MTDDQEKLITIFEARVRQLIFLCDTQKEKINLLTDSLNQKEAELQQVKITAEKTVNELNSKCEKLMMARVISVNQGEIKNAKQQLIKLVREVDKCIALLNE
jgi:hypothetical protein